MKTRLYPIAPTAAQRLALVRGISEGTRPTGRVLRTVPVKPFATALAAKWFQKSTNAQELASMNLISRYPVAPVAITQ